jgi:rare lipoprotein A
MQRFRRPQEHSLHPVQIEGSGPNQLKRGERPVNQRKFFAGSAIFMLAMLSTADHSAALAATAKKAAPDPLIAKNGAKHAGKSAVKSAKSKKPPFHQIGTASWYGPGLRGHKTASGEVLDPNALTAAHRSLPLDSKIRVTNLQNGKSVDVTINDRGPYFPGRVIDLSVLAAERLDIREAGLAKVSIESLTPEQLAAVPPIESTR